MLRIFFLLTVFGSLVTQIPGFIERGWDVPLKMLWAIMFVCMLFRSTMYVLDRQVRFLYLYLIPFLLGYFVFSHDAVQEKLKKAWIPLLACAVASGIVLVVTTFGQDNTSPQYLGSPLNCLYGWLMCLALMAWFQAKFDRTGRFAGYLTRTSFGIYIVHYLVIAALGYMMKTYTQLPPWTMYVILGIAVFTLSPLLYEVLHRIPFIRWCVFGEKGVRKA